MLKTLLNLSQHDEVRMNYGGKADSLVRMHKMCLPVPRAYFLPCRTEPLNETDLRAAIETFKAYEPQFGSGKLFSVRSGAPISMPGMMDTVLNVGVTKALYDSEGWLRETVESPEYASFKAAEQSDYDQILALVKEWLPDHQVGVLDKELMILLGIKHEEKTEAAWDEHTLDPDDALAEAIQNVYRSWSSENAVNYRTNMGIGHELGTGVVIQQMVFGNRNSMSGSGVAFSRHPESGEREIVMDYGIGLQGEAVVSGTAENLLDWEDFQQRHSNHAQTVEGILRDLEISYRDVVDLEFTLENNELYVLQARSAKRSPNAALRTALDMIFDDEIQLTRREVEQRAKLVNFDPHRDARTPTSEPHRAGEAINKGVVTGRILLPGQAPVPGEAYIFMSEETTPEDVSSMMACKGVITGKGGPLSHAALICREQGLIGALGILLPEHTPTHATIQATPDGVANVWFE